MVSGRPGGFVNAGGAVSVVFAICGAAAGACCLAMIVGDFTDDFVKAFTPTYESETARSAATPITMFTMFFLVSAFTLAFLWKAHEDSAQ